MLVYMQKAQKIFSEPSWPQKLPQKGIRSKSKKDTKNNLSVNVRKPQKNFSGLTTTLKQHDMAQKGLKMIPKYLKIKNSENKNCIKWKLLVYMKKPQKHLFSCTIRSH